MKIVKAKFRTSLVLLVIGLLGVMTAQSHQNKPDLEALAAQGRAITNADPAAQELREQQTDDAARHGFDIGMGVAQTDTLPGPGKDRIKRSLSNRLRDF